MKKKFTGFLVCLLMVCMTLFAGCNLVETDNSKMYNAVVAEIYNKNNVKVAEITNRDLLSGYQNYGALYVQSYGYTKAEAVKMTLTQLENRKIVVMTAEDEFGIDKTGKGLTAIEKAYLYESTVDSLRENLKYYYNQLVGSESSSATEENDNKTMTAYDKKVELSHDSNGNYILKKRDKNNGILDSYRPSSEYKDHSFAENKDEIYEDFVNSLYNEDYTKAYDNYYKDLRSAEYGLKLSTGANEVFAREIERLYNINYENYLVEKYNESFLNSTGISNVSVNKILSLYSSKVRAGYTQYVLEKDSGYNSDVSDALQDVYYFKNDSESTKYFTVANILFQFDDNQQATYKSLNAQLEANVGKDGYDKIKTDIDELYTQIDPVIRQYNSISGEYEVVDNTDNLTVDDIISDKIEIVLQNAQTTGNENFIGDTIADLIYQYNEDPGMFSAEMPYVIGVDKDGNAVSSFVESFNEAGLQLYNNGQGKIGDVAVAKSEYGIHVLVYTGACTNLFDGIDSRFDLSNLTNSNDTEAKEAIEILNNTRVNILNDKTYLDVLYDELYKDNSSYFQSANINFLREEYEITVYSGRFASSLKD